jgi:hypothetical protein
MPVYSCDNGKFRIGEGECIYDNREHAVNAYVGYLAQVDKKAVDLNKISFDFDDTLTLALYRARAKQLIERGKTVYIVTRRQDNFHPEQVYNVADEIGIPHSRVYFTNGEMKWKTIKRLNIAIHYDNNPDEIKLIEENTECKTYLVKSKDLMKSIYTTKFISAEIKDIDTKQGVVAGYFANFNTLDSDGDIIRPGAFNQTIKEWLPKGRVKHLLNHDVSKPLGKIIDLFEDDYGLFYKSEIGKHQLGQDFIKMAESGLVTEHSIGFRTLNEKSTDLGNEITHVQLYEGSSLTGWGANPNTPLVSIKSLSVETISERLKSFEHFVRKTTASDETIELCLIHIKQLYAQLNESGKLAEAVNLPAVKAESTDKTQLIKNINTIFELWKIK